MEFVNIIFAVSNIILICSYIVSGMLVLRTVVCIAEVVFIIGCYIAGLDSPGMLSNIIFSLLSIIINGVHIARLLMLKQPIDIPMHLKEAYKHLFFELDTKEFMKLCQMGTYKIIKDQILVESGTKCNLIVVLSGKIIISSGNKIINTLKGVHILGEISFLTDLNATATVYMEGPGEVYVWTKDVIDKINEWNPDLYVKIQGVFIKQLALKLINQNNEALSLAQLDRGLL